MKVWLFKTLVFLAYGIVTLLVVGSTAFVLQIIFARLLSPLPAWVFAVAFSALGWGWWWMSDENMDDD